MLNKIVINGLTLTPSCRAIRYSKAVEVMNESQCSRFNTPGAESGHDHENTQGREKKTRGVRVHPVIRQLHILCD